jgi:hypothetical protein
MKPPYRKPVYRKKRLNAISVWRRCLGLCAATILGGQLSLAPVSLAAAEPGGQETLVSMSETLGLKLVPAYEGEFWCFDSVRVEGRATRVIPLDDPAFQNLLRQLGPQVNFLCPEASDITLTLFDPEREPVFRASLRRDDAGWRQQSLHVHKQGWITGGPDTPTTPTTTDTGETPQQASVPQSSLSQPPVQQRPLRYPDEPGARMIRSAITRLLYGDHGGQGDEGAFQAKCPVGEALPSSAQASLVFACWAYSGDGAPTAQRLAVIQQFRKGKCVRAEGIPAYDCSFDLRLTALGAIRSIGYYEKPRQMTARFMLRDEKWRLIPR